jgi:hypothetical protein
MHSIKVIDGKVCIVKELTANTSLPTIKRELLFSVEQLLCALEQRMDHCINALHEAEQMDLVTEVTEYQVFYVDKSQSVRAFNIPSFEAMESAVKKLKELAAIEVACIPCEAMAKDFTRVELNQMKKAIISYFERWSDTASALEELETYKLQKREC